MIFFNPNLAEHLLYVAGDCNFVLPESAEEPCQIIVVIRPLKKLFVQRVALVTGTAVEHYSEFIWIVWAENTVMRYIPAIFT